ncbi:IMV membrane protein A9, partial [Monkeypox virus]
MSCYTAILKS